MTLFPVGHILFGDVKDIRSLTLRTDNFEDFSLLRYCRTSHDEDRLVNESRTIICLYIIKNGL